MEEEKSSLIGTTIGQDIEKSDDDDLESNRESICKSMFTWQRITASLLSTLTLVLIVYFFESAKDSGAICGIPVIWWSEIWFLIALCTSDLMMISSLVAWCYKDPNKEFEANEIVFPFAFFTMTAWTSYGFVLYTSDDNNCADLEETAPWLKLMIALLVFGCISFIVSFIFLIGICVAISVKINQWRMGDLPDEEFVPSSPKEGNNEENEGLIDKTLKNIETKEGHEDKTRNNDVV